MNSPALIFSKKTSNWTWFALALVLALSPLLSRAGPAHHRQRGYGYWGGGHRSYVIGPSTYHHPYSYSYSYPRYFPGYTYAYPRFQRYGYFRSYGTYGYHHPGFYYYQNFPAPEPRIYVVPQRRSSHGGDRTGPRTLIVYSAGDPLTSGQLPDYDGPPLADEGGFQPTPPPPKIDPEKAWHYLDQGLYRQAMGAFGHQSRANPENAQAKLGFGLAAALSEENISAAHGIRRALETDPTACKQIPLSDALRAKITSLADALKRGFEQDPDDMNLRFVHAALNHIIGQDQQAMASLEKAQSLGDTSLSSLHLKKEVMKGNLLD